MKWFFLLNNASFLAEFFGKLAHQPIERGDECLVVMNSKIAELGKKKFFPNNAKFISKVDWCAENYQKNKKEFSNLSWKELFPIFDRYSPRGFFNYNNSFNIVSQTYQFFEFIFNEYKPDAIVGEPPSGLFHEVAYYFCKKNNIPYIGMCGSRFENRIEVYDSEFTNSKYEKTFNEIKNTAIAEEEKNFAKAFIRGFVSHKQVPFYVGLAKIYFTQYGLVKHYIKRVKESGILLFKCFLKVRRFKGFDYETEIALKHAIITPWRAEKRKFKILFQKNIFFKIGDTDKNFFFFPLHYQPEASTSVWATYYNDQLNTIKNIAFTLPFPYKLYVKEHPASIGLRSGGFYKKLKELPNVVLISPEENIENIIRKSSGVITLTGTAGMEAALSGKPVYVLGNVFYTYHPLCRKVKNFDELRGAIEKDLTNKINTDNLEDINCHFIVSYFRNTIEGTIVSASQEKDTNNYELIYKNIYAISKKS